jgi:hypothetical protein
MVALLQKYGPCPIFITFTAAVLSLASPAALVVVEENMHDTVAT